MICYKLAFTTSITKNKILIANSEQVIVYCVKKHEFGYIT